MMILAVGGMISCSEEEGTNPGRDSRPNVVEYQFAPEAPYNADNDLLLRIAANSKVAEAYYLAEATTDREAHIASMGKDGYMDYVIKNGTKIDGLSGASDSDVTVTGMVGEYTITVVAVNGNDRMATEATFTGLKWESIGIGMLSSSFFGGEGECEFYKASPVLKYKAIGPFEEGYDIVFDHVAFAYNQKEQVLSDVSFTAKQGEVTALIGPSGGGKTTISRLAARFYDIDSGKITVGGMDISKIDPEKLLELYSIVFQDVTLFNNTIMENIRIGKKDATDQEVMAAAKLAHCDEFVENMPDQWNTMIGENGSELSGGQRQRISIARAFLKDAPIILMDEATASLDVDNESMIQESISKLIENKTVLIIAHRMRTVDGVDHIVVLKDGVVFEQGKPQDLKQQNGIYKHMVEMQMQSHNWKYE